MSLVIGSATSTTTTTLSAPKTVVLPTSPPSMATAAAASPTLAPTLSPTTATTTVVYPRTGKRGVPQQFARRLYEMLQTEERLAATADANAVADHPVYIAWSQSGRAFKISDVDAFTVQVLPKYFRTKKFSSFQRNLNLYGFSKVRRGPDTDMYAHPSFIRNKPELLFHLRKCPTSSSVAAPPSSSTSSASSSRTGATGKRIPSSPIKRKVKNTAAGTTSSRSIRGALITTSSTTCYESDHSTGGTVVSHEDHDSRVSTVAAGKRMLNATTQYQQKIPNVSTSVQHSAPIVVVPSPSKSQQQHYRPTNSSSTTSSSPWFLMPKTTAAAPPVSSSTPFLQHQQKKLPVGGLDMLAMAIDYA